MKKKKQKSIKELWKETWKYCSLYIRLRDSKNLNSKCITCGKHTYWKNANAGHYIHKSKTSELYFDPYNIHLQCVNCNLYNHGRLDSYSLRIIELYGIEKLNELHKRKYTLKQWKHDELEVVRDRYKKEAEELLKVTM